MTICNILGSNMQGRSRPAEEKQQEENVDYPDGGMFGTSERHLWHDDSSHLDFCEEFFRVLLGNHCHLSFACRDISMLCRAGGMYNILVGMTGRVNSEPQYAEDLHRLKTQTDKIE